MSAPADPLADPDAAPNRTDLVDRLRNPDAVLSRTDLTELGWPRRGVDAIMRHAGAVVLPGFTRPVVTIADYRAFLEAHRYDRRTHVR